MNPWSLPGQVTLAPKGNFPFLGHLLGLGTVELIGFRLRGFGLEIFAWDCRSDGLGLGGLCLDFNSQKGDFRCERP